MLTFCYPLQQFGEIGTKYKIHLKAAKDPIHGYLINPDLEAPQVIVDFPNNYKAWLEARRSEMEQPQTVASEEEVTQFVETQELDTQVVEQLEENTTSQTGDTTHSDVEDEAAPSDKNVIETKPVVEDQPETQVVEIESAERADTSDTQEISFTETGSKRKAEEISADEDNPPEKIPRVEDAFVTALHQHSDLITVNDADLTTTVVDVVTDSSIPANIEVVADDGEDDLAAELPDGFYSTSCKCNISYCNV